VARDGPLLEISMKKFFLAAALVFAGSAFAAADWVPGEVVSLDPARKLVILKHGRIESIGMDAMTMPFKTREAAQLAPLKVGDKVRFQVVVQDGDLVVQHIEVQR
jgi:Cu/Ag efflux protein CusF